MPMLEYQKMILQKVSFDRSLFEKELRKTILLLSRDERKAFVQWAIEHFADRYADILRRCLTTSRIAA
ncbi:MAG: hypothetical protein ACFCUI_07350 [Bernardetiaceae bacterium]